LIVVCYVGRLLWAAFFFVIVLLWAVPRETLECAMAKSVVVAVRDGAMMAFGRPLFVPSIGVAVRSFADEVNRSAEDNQMNKHPEDFELYVLAEFEEETGVFSLPVDGVRCLARGKEYVK